MVALQSRITLHLDKPSKKNFLLSRSTVTVAGRPISESGFAPVITGALAESTRQEPGSEVYNVVMTPDEVRAELAELD